jgi:hypothetical protein
MKINILYIIILLIVSSCDNRKDNYVGMDTGPIFQVAKLADANYSNGISDSEKLGQTYTFKYQLQSFDNLNINIQKSNTYDNLNVNSLTSLISVQAIGAEYAVYKLNVVDPFGKSANATVQLTIFKNLLPVCVFTDTLLAQLSPYQVFIDASRSYDQDAKWGGTVVQYQYIIGNNYTSTTKMSSLNYIFDGPGQKVIKVRCQDNDSAWSVPVTKYLTIKN